MSKFTKGPWTVFEQPDRKLKNCGYVQIRASGRVLLEMGGFGTGHDVNVANARLIAAAPSLLSELRMLVLSICGAEALEGTHTCHRCACALAAINAAEGGAE